MSKTCAPIKQDAALQALRLKDHGAQLFPAAVGEVELRMFRDAAADALEAGPGARLYGAPMRAMLSDESNPVRMVASRVLGQAAEPVRAILFNKTPGDNWSVGWHQDRTIAVRERCDVPGFDPWTVKAGVPHVQPPFDIIRRLITARVHLDACGPDNSPLLIAPGSHCLGKIRNSEARAVARRLGAIACLAKAGDIWAYATAILHASERASSSQPRRVLHVDFADFALPGCLEWLGVSDP